MNVLAAGGNMNTVREYIDIDGWFSKFEGFCRRHSIWHYGNVWTRRFRRLTKPRFSDSPTSFRHYLIILCNIERKTTHSIANRGLAWAQVSSLYRLGFYTFSQFSAWKFDNVTFHQQNCPNSPKCLVLLSAFRRWSGRWKMDSSQRTSDYWNDPTSILHTGIHWMKEM